MYLGKVERYQNSNGFNMDCRSWAARGRQADQFSNIAETWYLALDGVRSAGYNCTTAVCCTHILQMPKYIQVISRLSHRNSFRDLSWGGLRAGMCCLPNGRSAA